jgi:hypothetical protein
MSLHVVAKEKHNGVIATKEFVHVLGNVHKRREFATSRIVRRAVNDDESNLSALNLVEENLDG